MITTPSLAGIPFSRVHTQDPLIAQWALNSIGDLRRWNEASADEAIRALFDEATIGLLMSEFTDNFLLLCLFRELPDDLLQPHLPFLADIWRDLPAWNSSYPLGLLVRHCPERALEIFLEFLQQPPHEPERLYAIIEASRVLPELMLRQFADACMKEFYHKAGYPTRNPTLTIMLTDLAWHANHLQLLDLIRIIATAMPELEQDAIDSDLTFLMGTLMGTTEPLVMIQDEWEGYIVSKFAEIPLFFPNTLAVELDDVIRKLGNLDYRPALDFYEQYKQCLPERVIPVLDACRDVWLNIPDLAEHDAATGLFALFPACIAAAAWATNPEPATDETDAILSFLTTNLQDVPVTDAIVSHFTTLERVQAVACLTEALEEQKDMYGSVRIAEIMGRLRYQEFIQPLIDATHADFDLLCDACATALVGFGEEAVGAIITVLESDQEEKHYYLESILEKSGSELAVAYFDRHFDALAKSDKEALASAIEALPEQRFIERLAPLTGKGQSELDRACLILNKLHGIASEELTALEEEYLACEAEDAARRAALDISDLGKITRDELNLEMVCSGCGDISRYAVESVFISGTEPKPFIADVLICLGCGAEDTLTLTSSGSMTITAELMRLTGIKGKEAREAAAENSPLTIMPRLTAMGKEMGISEAIALYQKEIARNPTKVELQLGYANILRFIKRFDKAADCYEEAVRIEPRLIEGWFELSQLEQQQGNYQKAFFALYEGARHLPDMVFHHIKPNERSEFINAYVAGYNDYKKRISFPGPSLSQSMFGAPAKVGRNDPCSCGSGKKFKKCCGK